MNIHIINNLSLIKTKYIYTNNISYSLPTYILYTFELIISIVLIRQSTKKVY